MENDWIVQGLKAFLEVLERNCLDEYVLLTGPKVLQLSLASIVD